MHGSQDKLAVSREKVYEHLGITIYFSLKLGVTFIRHDFIKKFWLWLPLELGGPCRNNTAPEFLFKVDKDAKLVDQKHKYEHYATTAKSVYLSQISRPGMKLAAGFHCARVKKPDAHDWNKLCRVMGCVWKTRNLPLKIVIDGDGDVHIYVDGAHAIYDGGKCESGLFFNVRRGSMINQSKKLGVVTVSSTKAEIAFTGESFPKCAWFHYFRMSQGDVTKEDDLIQYDQSSIRMHKNSQYSTSKGAKHAHTRYFLQSTIFGTRN